MRIKFEGEFEAETPQQAKSILKWMEDQIWRGNAEVHYISGTDEEGEDLI